MRDWELKLHVDGAHLGQFAENRAKQIRTNGKRSCRLPMRALRQDLDRIRHTFRRCTDLAAVEPIAREVEWLLDNRYIAEREGRGCLNTLKETPPLPFVREEKQAASSILASALAEAGQGQLSLERIEVFLESVQNYHILNEAELAAFTTLLKAALIKIIADVCGEIDRCLSLRGKSPEIEPFAAELMLKKAEESGGEVSDRIRALSEKAAERHRDLERLMGNAFDSLRLLSTADLEPVLQRVDRVERELMEDPMGIYPLMDDDSRAACRHELMRLAKKNGISSVEAARRAVELARESKGSARHVGTYIFTKPLGRQKREHSGRLYIAAIWLPAVLLAGLVYFATKTVWLPLLLLIPLSDFVKGIVDSAVLRFKKPTRVLRIEKPEEMGEEAKTVCVISALLCRVDDGPRLADALERYSIANRDSGGYLSYGILADLPDSDARTTKREHECVISARDAIDRLNKKYGGGFYLFFRERAYSERDGKFLAPERKRGAITELMRLISGNESALQVLSGDEARLGALRYVLTLDSDTRLNSGAASKLVGAMLHPINRPVVDTRRHIVTRGYGLIQPRIGVDLEAAGRSRFAAVYAGQGGIDPYASAVSDVYMDLFGEGSYTGKGIIDVRAFMACLDGRFPKEQILSHDLIEGCYLRGGFMGDVELSDGYPYKATSYFSRLHRWTRGDWQLLPRLFKHVKNESGAKERNPLSLMSRYKIFDNLRRSLVAPALLAALLAGMLQSGAAFLTAAIATLLCLGANLFITAAVSLFRRGQGGRSRYHSSIVTGVEGVIIRTVLQFVLLAQNAWVSISAVVTALFRMLVSKRRLLNWVTAAEAERVSGNSVFYYYRNMWASPVLAIVPVALSPFPAGITLGIIWAFAPLISCFLSRMPKPGGILSRPDRLFLERQGTLIWSWFAEFCSEEDNYLPPDNFQEQPASGIAHRTSPTNIGLAALSALVAIDLKFTTTEKALNFIDHLLTSVEKLGKWQGHLYNWYDTKTLKPLRPLCVSTVDSGNLVGCLMTLSGGLSARRDQRSTELASRASRLAESCGFTRLYDESRRLFYIGFDLEKNAPMSGWYDLMASEARLTSYIAVARGDVPRRHWGRLSRALVGLNGYKGMASWTGTMFEYLMPNLLMPCYKNSLIYESDKFCVMAQRARTRGTGAPWGISESAYYAFDNGLNYQYKAHGVQRLGLKRGLDKELVISPYSTFLALLTEPHQAVRNLVRLSQTGLEGKYGMYEAADYTPSRQSEGSTFRPVRCYMAHHIGMSLVALDNVLRGNIMQKRFMSDVRMKAFSELLEEKVPVDATVLRYIDHEIPERASRLMSERWIQQCAEPNPFSPRCTLLSNSSYSLLLSDSGHSRADCGGLRLYRFEPLTIGGASGMNFFLRLGERLMPLTPLPLFDEGVEYSSVFEAEKVVYRAMGGGVCATMGVGVSASDNCEIREIQVENRGFEGSFELVCLFEPVLEKAESFESHPAFSKLSMETELRGGTLVVTRRAREGGSQSLAVALNCEDYGFDTSKEIALGRGGCANLANALKSPPRGTLGPVLDPCVLIRKKFDIPAGEKFSLRLALSTAVRPADAAAAAERAVLSPSHGECAVKKAAFSLGLGPSDISSAMSMLSDLVFVTPSRRRRGELTVSASRAEALWRFGVSGDCPIIMTEFNTKDDLQRMKKLMCWHSLLSFCGFKSDLCIVTRDGGEYHRPLFTALRELTKELCRESVLNARGGIHILDIDEECTAALKGFAGLYLEKDGAPDPLPKKQLKRRPAIQSGFTVSEPEHRFLPDGSFSFLAGSVLPPLCWSHTLSNETFGYTATDTGTGHMWNINARENKLSPWINDPLAVDGGELLRFKNERQDTSLFADGGDDCRVTYGFGFARWERDGLSLTAFVPPGVSARVFLIESRQPGDITWYCEPVLGCDYQDSLGCVSSESEGVIYVKNPRNTEFPGQTALFAAGRSPQGFTCDRDSWYSGEFDGACGAHFSPCAALSYKCAGRLALVAGCFGTEDEKAAILALTDPDAAQKSLDDTIAYWRATLLRLEVKTPEKHLDNYLNGWALYQTLACRISGRTSIYQCGGAYGFRDQLQDCCAILDAAPDKAKEHILLAAAHQFTEGDAQHWWHPNALGEGTEKGVRTRYTDDLLWLPYAVCQYIEKTGDEDILDARVHWLSSPPLNEDEDERYETPQASLEKSSLFRHCVAALDLTLERGFGEHGLCLIGGGDWNDGFNKIGAKGRGESVWLSWFYSHVLELFAPAALRRGEPELAEKYRDTAQKLTGRAGEAWDGNWFARAYYDDGTALGVSANSECRIDGIAQGMAALPEHHDREKVKTALLSAVKELYCRDSGVVRLLSPPFSGRGRRTGYIESYLPGIRENGGQYTHGGVWLALGCLKSGLNEEGYELLRAMLPGGRDGGVYKTEPYVLTADVYYNPGHIGRGGWSWYTGASGWYYRVAVEELLGISISDGVLRIKPRIPEAWEGFEAVYRAGGGSIAIKVMRGRGRDTFPDGIRLDAVKSDISAVIWLP